MRIRGLESDVTAQSIKLHLSTYGGLDGRCCQSDCCERLPNQAQRGQHLSLERFGADNLFLCFNHFNNQSVEGLAISWCNRRELPTQVPTFAKSANKNGPS